MSLFSKLILGAVASGTIILVSANPVLAFDCGGQISACLRNNANKPDAKAKCAAAGQACARSGTFVGPYNGQSYQVQQRRNCQPGSRMACY